MAFSDILPGSNGDDELFRQFDDSEAAADLKPVPKGQYVVVAMSGELTTAKTGTRGYRVCFKIIEGEHAARKLWRTWHITPAAMPYTRRDLAKIGIDNGEKMKRPLPAERFVCRLYVVIRAGDDGIERNEITSIELIRVQDPPVDPFAPPPDEPPPDNPPADNLFGSPPSSPSAGRAQRL